MIKVVINNCFGGFSLSDEALRMYAKEKKLKEFCSLDGRAIKRDDADLVAVVERLGDKANGVRAKLKIVEIPDGVDWIIDEYDGKEWVAERHRTWE